MLLGHMLSHRLLGLEQLSISANTGSNQRCANTFPHKRRKGTTLRVEQESVVFFSSRDN